MCSQSAFLHPDVSFPPLSIMLFPLFLQCILGNPKEMESDPDEEVICTPITAICCSLDRYVLIEGTASVCHPWRTLPSDK